MFYFQKAPGFVTRSDCLLFLSVSVPSPPPPRCAPLSSPWRPVSGRVPAQVCGRGRGFVPPCCRDTEAPLVILCSLPRSFRLINGKLLRKHRKSCFVSVRSPRNTKAEHRARLLSSDTSPPLWQLHRTREQTPHLPHSHTRLSDGVPGHGGSPAAAPGPHLAACRGQRGQPTFDTPVTAVVAVRMERGGVKSEQREAGRQTGVEGNLVTPPRDEEGAGEFWWFTIAYCGRLVQMSQRDERAPSSLEDSSLLLPPLHLTLYYLRQLRQLHQDSAVVSFGGWTLQVLLLQHE